MAMRTRLGTVLLRWAVRLLTGSGDLYYIIPRSKLPPWLDEYIEYLEAVDFLEQEATREGAGHGSRGTG